MFVLLTFLSVLPVLTYSQLYLAFIDMETISGQTTQFSCAVNFQNNIEIVFNVTSVLITTPQNGTLTHEVEFPTNHFLFSFPNTRYENRGVYTCHVGIIDNQGSQSTLMNTATLTVLVPAAIVNDPQGRLSRVGVPFSISCRAEGVPTASVSWLREGQAIPDVTRVSDSTSIPFTNSTLNFPYPLQNQSGNYSCQARNMYSHDDNDFLNFDNSTAALILIHPPPMVTSLEDRNVTLNQSISVVCNATGVLPLSFAWNNLSDPSNDLSSNSQLTIQHLDTASILTIAQSSRQSTGYYQCTVRNDFGNDTAQMYLLVQEEPSAPSQVSTSVLARSVLISWTPSFDGNSPIIEFIIDLMQGGSYVQVALVPGADTSYNVTGLTPYSPYTFRVRARNLLGESDPSPSITVETAQAEPDAAPRNFTLLNITSDMIMISWFPPLVAKWNGPITGFLIEYTLFLISLEGASTVYTFPSIIATPLESSQENNQFSTSVNNLESYRNYSLRISACTVVGCGVYSDALNALTAESAPSMGPSFLSVEPTAVSIRLSWAEIPLGDRNGVIQSYTVRFIDGNYSTLLRTGNDSLDFTIHGLSPYTTYSVSVAGETTALGPFGNETEVRTNEAPPSAPVSLRVTYLSYTQVSFQWSPPVSPNGVITSYTLYYNQSLPTLVTRSNTTLQPPIVVSGFAVAYPLSASVSANTSAGEGVRSSVLTVQPARPPYILTMDNASNVTTHTRNVNVFIGEALSLDCLIEAIPGPQFAWMSNLTGSLNDLPETVPRYYVPETGPEFTNYYVCTGSNLFGSATVMFHVAVVELPKAFVQYSTPEFCTGGNGGYNCLEGESMYISCTYSQGLPKPYVNFTLEGVALQDVMVTANGAIFYIDALSSNTSRLYACEVSNTVGSDRGEFFINLVGRFTIEENEGVVEWALPDSGYVDGNYVIEYGSMNVSENVANISSLSPLNLHEVITDPGMYAWRLKFLNQYGDAAVSVNYPFVVRATVPQQQQQQQNTLYWIIGAIAFLCLTILITFILIILVCVCLCKCRRKHSTSQGTQAQQVVSNVATTGFTAAPPVERTSDVPVPPVKKSRKKQEKSSPTFRRTEEYNKHEAYRGPLAFHNQALDPDLDYASSKPAYTTFKPASNLHFKGHKASPDEQIGGIGFRRRTTPDFPAPPSIENLSKEDAGLREVVNLTPPPPPVPEATYHKLF